MRMNDKENANTKDDSNSETSEKSSEENKTSENIVSIADVASNLIENEPAISQNAITEHERQEHEKIERYSEYVDCDGNHFDPAIHKTTAAGEPTLSTRNKLIKKPGRKPGSNKHSVIHNPNTSPELAKPSTSANSRASGVLVARSFVGIASLISDEWKPVKSAEYGVDEMAQLENAFGDYFEATGKTDIPPGVALAIAMSGYVLPRLSAPKTKKRVGGFFTGIRKWFARRKLKKAGLEVDGELIETEENEQDA